GAGHEHVTFAPADRDGPRLALAVPDRPRAASPTVCPSFFGNEQSKKLARVAHARSPTHAACLQCWETYPQACPAVAAVHCVDSGADSAPEPTRSRASRHTAPEAARYQRRIQKRLAARDAEDDEDA